MEGRAVKQEVSEKVKVKAEERVTVAVEQETEEDVKCQ